MHKMPDGSMMPGKMTKAMEEKGEPKMSPKAEAKEENKEKSPMAKLFKKKMKGKPDGKGGPGPSSRLDFHKDGPVSLQTDSLATPLVGAGIKLEKDGSATLKGMERVKPLPKSLSVQSKDTPSVGGAVKSLAGLPSKVGGAMQKVADKTVGKTLRDTSKSLGSAFKKGMDLKKRLRSPIGPDLSKDHKVPPAPMGPNRQSNFKTLPRSAAAPELPKATEAKPEPLRLLKRK